MKSRKEKATEKSIAKAMDSNEAEITKRIIRGYIINRYKKIHDLGVNISPQRDYLREANLNLSLTEIFYYLFQYHSAKARGIQEQIGCYQNKLAKISAKSGSEQVETFDTSNFQVVMMENGTCRGTGFSGSGFSLRKQLGNVKFTDKIVKSKLDPNSRGTSNFINGQVVPFDIGSFKSNGGKGDLSVIRNDLSALNKRHKISATELSNFAKQGFEGEKEGFKALIKNDPLARLELSDKSIGRKSLGIKTRTNGQVKTASLTKSKVDLSIFR